eukprot:m.255934 g.255934  ORF g.255934 m.255934 type:complete len:372 (+) comp54547_c0_seq2:1447-2562(+)
MATLYDLQFPALGTPPRASRGEQTASPDSGFQEPVSRSELPPAPRTEFLISTAEHIPASQFPDEDEFEFAGDWTAGDWDDDLELDYLDLEDHFYDLFEASFDDFDWRGFDDTYDDSLDLAEDFENGKALRLHNSSAVRSKHHKYKRGPRPQTQQDRSQRSRTRANEHKASRDRKTALDFEITPDAEPYSAEPLVIVRRTRDVETGWWWQASTRPVQPRSYTYLDSAASSYLGYIDRDFLHDSDLRRDHTRRVTSSGRRFRHPDRQLETDLVISRSSGVLSAQELGLDEATYRALIGLQFRDITSDDYSTLSTLDENVVKRGVDSSLISEFDTFEVVISDQHCKVCAHACRGRLKPGVCWLCLASDGEGRGG